MGPRERRWLAAAVMVLALCVGLWIDSAASLLGDDALLRLCATALVVELWVAAVAVGPGLLARASLSDVLGLGRGRLSGGELALLAVGTLAASHALDGWLEQGGRAREGLLGELPRLLGGATGARLGVALLALGVAPGIAEELLCRGLIQRGIARRLGVRVGIPVAALVFGTLHVDPVHAGFAAILGLYLGAVAHLADSTRAAIVCHTTNNLAAVALAAGAGIPWTSPASLLAAGALSIACLGLVARRHVGLASPLAAPGRTRLPGGPT